MLNDGVGAAVAGANELQSTGGLILASRAEIVATIQKQLTGGGYVRFLFLTDGEHFALASREGASGGRSTPAWLTVSRAPSASDTWAGAPIEDPERPGEFVIPVAQRVAWGQGATLWAGALFSFDGFDDLYRQFSDQVVTIGLITTDGTVLVRAPKLAGRDGHARGLNDPHARRRGLWGHSARLRMRRAAQLPCLRIRPMGCELRCSALVLAARAIDRGRHRAHRTICNCGFEPDVRPPVHRMPRT
jgi:hypothetical protein